MAVPSAEVEVGARSRNRRFSVRVVTVEWAVLMSLWMLLVGTRATAEVLAGTVASALAAFAVEVVVRHGGPLRVKARWLPRLLRLPPRVAIEFLAVMRAMVGGLLGRRGGGRFVVLGLAAAPDSRGEPTRRALIALAGSLAPNAFVVGFEDGEPVPANGRGNRRVARRVLVHQMETEDRRMQLEKLRGTA